MSKFNFKNLSLSKPVKIAVGTLVAWLVLLYFCSTLAWLLLILVVIAISLAAMNPESALKLLKEFNVYRKEHAAKVRSSLAEAKELFKSEPATPEAPADEAADDTGAPKS